MFTSYCAESYRFSGEIGLHSPIFRGEINIFGKIPPKGQEQHKNRVFGLVRKIKPLVLFGKYLKERFLWLFNILQKLHIREQHIS